MLITVIASPSKVVLSWDPRNVLAPKGLGSGFRASLGFRVFFFARPYQAPRNHTKFRFWGLCWVLKFFPGPSMFKVGQALSTSP